MSNELFDTVKSINYDKKNFHDVSSEKSYNAFMVNKFLSQSASTILPANLMNRNYHLPNEMQYDFLKTIIPRGKRYEKFTKKDIQMKDEVDAVSFYYDVNKKRAYEYVKQMPDSEIDVIKKNVKLGLKKNVCENWF